MGLWAVNGAACGAATWRLTDGRLDSPGLLHCNLDKVVQTPAGYTIDGLCSNGGAGMPGRITATFSEPSPSTSMTLAGGPFPTPLALVRCSATAVAQTTDPSARARPKGRR